MSEWPQQEIRIGDVQQLLQDGYEIEVDSPDGWVKIIDFVDKGSFQEYILTTENGYTLRCNADHRVKTTLGWMSAVQLLFVQNITGTNVHINTVNGFSKVSVTKTSDVIPIVDIQVDHPNKRYYSADIESHNTGIGKSLIMCNNAAHDLLQGLNVLYITLEMAEERIAERIDANLLNIPLDELEMLDKSTYLKKGDRLRAKTQGKLIIKEYPAAGAHVGHFRHMINELRLKKKFIPDIIYIDYLNLCTSSRIKMGGSVNTNTYVKAIAEEIRGLATELGIPIESATQTNRTGYGNSDLELSETSESYGLNSTVDFMCAVMQDEDMAALNQFMFKQLKSRYGDINKYKRFIVGVDKARMRLYDVDPEAQRDLMDGPVMDNTGFGHEDNERAKKSRKRDFGSFS